MASVPARPSPASAGAVDRLAVPPLPPLPPADAPLPWAADLGDGHYRNPILFADYSDPDVIRVGDDYWMTASSFNHVPALPVLHSRDLVNWTLVNHALPALRPREHFATPRHGEGVWAPAIRHHAGRFWIYYPDPDFGISLLTAGDPRGPWSEPHLVLPGQGLIDPCPLWDEDGRCYLVHGWARSRAGISNRVTLHELSTDGREALNEGRVVIDGSALPGWHTLEGPKLYRRQGWYWIFAPAGGVGEGYQAVFRAQQIEGPYEARIVLAQGRTPINGPHQGAWVETPAGEDWFIHFQERPAYGRVVHLQPMRWRDDGWPEMGVNVNDAGCGEPVLRHRKPALPVQPRAVPATSDNFSSPDLARQWQWQANPQPGWLRLDPASRTLELRCVPLAREDSHWLAPHLLLQKFPAPAFSVTVRMRLDAAADGDRAGLMVFGYDYAWLGWRRRGSALELAVSIGRDAHEGGVETVAEKAEGGPPFSATDWISLRVDVAPEAACTFSWSRDGSRFVPIGPVFTARSSRWVGAKLGLFASTAPVVDGGAGGWARYRDFRVSVLPRP